MSNPEAAGASALAAALTVVDKVTPARSALDWAAEMDAALWSLPEISVGVSDGLNPISESGHHASHAKVRNPPGGRPSARTAASIRNVPEPHMGS